jgi:hypothetical protein
VRLVLASLLILGCATHHIPEALEGYDVLVEGKDVQSMELARALRSYGFRVRDRVRGGSRPTLALIHFTFSEPGPGEPPWLYIRLADTRSGAIVGAGAVPLDSVASVRASAIAVVRAMLAP